MNATQTATLVHKRRVRKGFIQAGSLIWFEFPIKYLMYNYTLTRHAV